MNKNKLYIITYFNIDIIARFFPIWSTSKDQAIVDWYDHHAQNGESDAGAMLINGAVHHQDIKDALNRYLIKPLNK